MKIKKKTTDFGEKYRKLQSKHWQNIHYIIIVCGSYVIYMVRIKQIAIAKCDLFLHYRNAKEIILLSSRYKTLCKTRKNTREFHLYCCDHVCKVNEWYSVHCFHREFRVSTRIIVRDYCIAKCKKFPVCGFYFPSVPSGHFFSWFKIFTLIRTLI